MSKRTPGPSRVTWTTADDAGRALCVPVARPSAQHLTAARTDPNSERTSAPYDCQGFSTPPRARGQHQADKARDQQPGPEPSVAGQGVISTEGRTKADAPVARRRALRSRSRRLGYHR